MFRRLLLISVLFLVSCDASAPAEDAVADPAEPSNEPQSSPPSTVVEPAPAAPAEEPIAGSRYTLDAVGYTVGRLSATPVRNPAPPDVEGFAQWQPAARANLIRSMIVFRFEPGQLPFETATLASESFDGYRRDEISYFVERGLRGRAFLYVPDAPGPHPAVIFWHGHTFGGYHSSAGVLPYERESNPHHAGAVALAEAGFVVLAPNIRTFGPGGGVEAHEHYVRIMNMAGASALGAFAADAHRAVDVLTSIPEVDTDRIGVTGLSLGGLLSLLNAALDERIAVAVPQGYFGSFRESLLTSQSCPCQYAGALGLDLDVADLAALVAPKPLRIVAGERDPEFPLESQSRAFERLQASYALAGAPDAAEFAVHDGAHEWNAVAAIEFLNRHLVSAR